MKNVLTQVEFSVEEHDAVQQALRQRLGPEFISQRVGAGGLKVRIQRTLETEVLVSIINALQFKQTNINSR